MERLRTSIFHELHRGFKGNVTDLSLVQVLFPMITMVPWSRWVLHGVKLVHIEAISTQLKRRRLNSHSSPSASTCEVC